MCVWMGSVGYGIQERCGLIGFIAASSLHCKMFLWHLSSSLHLFMNWNLCLIQSRLLGLLLFFRYFWELDSVLGLLATVCSLFFSCCCKRVMCCCGFRERLWGFNCRWGCGVIVHSGQRMACVSCVIVVFVSARRMSFQLALKALAQTTSHVRRENLKVLWIAHWIHKHFKVGQRLTTPGPMMMRHRMVSCLLVNILFVSSSALWSD
jgi:hypothetical protein